MVVVCITWGVPSSTWGVRSLESITLALDFSVLRLFFLVSLVNAFFCDVF